MLKAQTRPVKVVIYGIGAMGALSTRLLVDRGAEIVGAIGRSPEKVGKDLGLVVGLGRSLGVSIEADAEAVLRRGADIAVVCVGSYLEMMHDHFAACLRNGVNVVTIEEESVYPWTSDPERAQSLDALAKANEVTLAASGAQDVFWLNLVTTLLGASHRIDKVIGRSVWNVDDYGPEVANHLHVGRRKADFENHVATHGWPEFVARQTLEAMAAQVGLTPKTIRSAVEPVTSEEVVHCQSLGADIEPGSLIGTIDLTELITQEGPRFEFTMEGRVLVEGEQDSNEWRVVGEPELELKNDGVPTRFVTCSTLINRIVDVIKAQPGLLSLDRLGPPGFRGPLHI